MTLFDPRHPQAGREYQPLWGGKRPLRCWPWTNFALRLLAVSNSFHECRSTRTAIGAGLFRLLKGKTS